MTVKRALVFAAILLLVTSCASGPTPRDLAQLTYYRMTHKVLVFVPGPDGLVSCWVSERNIPKGAAQCQADAFAVKSKVQSQPQTQTSTGGAGR